MTPWQQAIVSALAPVLVFGGAWMQARYSRRTGKEANTNTSFEKFSEAQAKFNEQLQGQLSGLQERVSSLEVEVRKERDLRERILTYARSLYWAWRRQFPNDPPPIAPESIATYFD